MGKGALKVVGVIFVVVAAFYIFVFRPGQNRQESIEGEINYQYNKKWEEDYFKICFASAEMTYRERYESTCVSLGKEKKCKLTPVYEDDIQTYLYALKDDCVKNKPRH